MGVWNTIHSKSNRQQISKKQKCSLLFSSTVLYISAFLKLDTLIHCHVSRKIFMEHKQDICFSSIFPLSLCGLWRMIFFQFVSKMFTIVLFVHLNPPPRSV